MTTDIKENTYHVIAIAADRKMDAMMHNFDVFEPFKRLGEVVEFDVTSTLPLSIIIPNLKKKLEDEGGIVSAIFSPNIEEGAWRDQSVKVISTGLKWGMLEEHLKLLLYKGS